MNQKVDPEEACPQVQLYISWEEAIRWLWRIKCVPFLLREIGNWVWPALLSVIRKPSSSDGLDSIPQIFLPPAFLPVVHFEMLVVPDMDRDDFSPSTTSVNKNRLKESGKAGNSPKEVDHDWKDSRNVFWGIKEDFFFLRIFFLIN